MTRAITILVLLFGLAACLDLHTSHPAPAAAPQSETLKCIRTREVGADAQLIYKCRSEK